MIISIDAEKRLSQNLTYLYHKSCEENLAMFVLNEDEKTVTFPLK
jgi:hypothetical protein